MSCICEREKKRACCSVQDTFTGVKNWINLMIFKQLKEKDSSSKMNISKNLKCGFWNLFINGISLPQGHGTNSKSK